jgi:hypothetical protein
MERTKSAQKKVSRARMICFVFITKKEKCPPEKKEGGKFKV